MLKSSDEGGCLRTMTDDDIWRLERNYCQEARTALLIARCKTAVSNLQLCSRDQDPSGGALALLFHQYVSNTLAASALAAT